MINYAPDRFADANNALRMGQSIRPIKPAAAMTVEGSGMAVMVNVLPSKVDPPKPPVPLKVKPFKDRLFVVWKTSVLPWLKLPILSASSELGV